MKKLLLYFFLMAGIQLMFSQGGLIECKLTTKKTVLKTGEVPILELTFINNSDQDIYLIKPLDASSYKWRYPHAYYTIEHIEIKDYKTQPIERCGNMNGINTGDFIMVKGSEILTPSKNSYHYFYDYSVLNPNNFEQKGKYKITYHYSTLSKDLADYMGYDMKMDIYEFDTIERDSINPPKLIKRPHNASKNLVAELESLFAKVPKVELTSNSVIIEVK